jgi:2-polyprenyl-6-methoxyphenol hydroxylase-like FAD-dependent oxidoreductase
MAARHAEIADAGLSGLMTATRLAQLGWGVRLHERSAYLRMFGAGPGRGKRHGAAGGTGAMRTVRRRCR